MLSVSLPVGLIGKNGYTNAQMKARAAVGEKIGIPIIPQIVLYGNGYSKDVIEKGVKDMKSILGYDTDSKGLLVHEDYRTNVFFEEGLEIAKKNMSCFEGQNVSAFLIHFPKLLDYGLDGLLYHKTLSRFGRDVRTLTGRSVFDKSPFSMAEYEIFRRKSAEAVLKAKEYARQKGFGDAMSLETVNAHDIIVVPSEPELNAYFGGKEGFAKLLGEESAIKYLDRDHIGLERVVAGGIDLGGLTCSLDEINNFSRETGTKICIDSEHLNIDHEISKAYNPWLLERIFRLDENEKGILKDRGFVLIRGLPRIYDKPLDAEYVAGNIENACKVGHITGGFEAETRVNGVLYPSTHIGIDPESNFFIGDDKAREAWWQKTKERVKRFTRIMKGNGIETIVLEPKLGTYVDGKFVISYEEPYYSQEMSKTVRNFLELSKD